MRVHPSQESESQTTRESEEEEAGADLCGDSR